MYWISVECDSIETGKVYAGDRYSCYEIDYDELG